MDKNVLSLIFCRLESTRAQLSGNAYMYLFLPMDLGYDYCCMASAASVSTDVAAATTVATAITL